MVGWRNLQVPSKPSASCPNVGTNKLYSQDRCESSRRETIMWGVPKIRGTFLGIPKTKTIVCWGLYWGTLILGNYHVSTLTSPFTGCDNPFEQFGPKRFRLSCVGSSNLGGACFWGKTLNPEPRKGPQNPRAENDALTVETCPAKDVFQKFGILCCCCRRVYCLGLIQGCRGIHADYQHPGIRVIRVYCFRYGSTTP